MKKIVTIILFLISLNLMAQEAKEVKKEESNFKFTGQAYAYTASYNTIKKDEVMTFSAYRFRPYFSYINNNVEATLKLEFDQFFGSGTPAEKYVKVGADTRNVVEVKAAYLLFKNILTEGLYAKGGIDDYKTPGGLIVGTDVAMFNIGYKFDKNYISFIYLKIDESNEKINDDDAQMYGIDSEFFLNIIKIRPAIYLIQGGDLVTNKPWTDNIAILPSLGINIKVENIEASLSGVYAIGEDKENKIKYSGYALDVYGGYNVDKDIKIGVFFTMLSGDDPDTTKKEGFASFQLKHDGFGRMFLLENQQTFSNIAADTFADVRSKTQGYMLIGLTGYAKFSILDFKLNLGYANLMKETSSTKTKKDLGFEADLSVGLEVQKNAKIVLDLAYLATGKAFGPDGFGSSTTQDSIYAAIGMTLRF